MVVVTSIPSIWVRSVPVMRIVLRADRLWRVPLLFLPEPFLALFFRQTGSMASVLELLEILL